VNQWNRLHLTGFLFSLISMFVSQYKAVIMGRPSSDMCIQFFTVGCG
jgi:hypothetical protein